MFVFLFASLGSVLVRRLALKFEIGLDLPEGRPEVAGNGLEPGGRCGGGGCVAQVWSLTQFYSVDCQNQGSV